MQPFHFKEVFTQTYRQNANAKRVREFLILAKFNHVNLAVGLPGCPRPLSRSAETSEEGQGIILLAKAVQAGGGAVSASAVPSVGALPSAAFTHLSQRLFLRFRSSRDSASFNISFVDRGANVELLFRTLQMLSVFALIYRTKQIPKKSFGV